MSDDVSRRAQDFVVTHHDEIVNPAIIERDLDVVLRATRAAALTDACVAVAQSSNSIAPTLMTETEVLAVATLLDGINFKLHQLHDDTVWPRETESGEPVDVITRTRLRHVIRGTLDRFAGERKIRIVPEVHDELAAAIEKSIRLLVEKPSKT